MQPVPKPNGTQPIHEQVIEDIKRRAEVGKQNYGTYLQVNNGRDPLLDAYEEAQDKALYLKQAILERDDLIKELELAREDLREVQSGAALLARDRRIRELEAELQVRDNMGDEVLRLLREATGRRDFHSEMEAAEWAAKMLANARLDSARLDWLQEWMKFGRNDLLTRYRVFDGKMYANRIHPDDAMGAKAIPGQDNIRAAIDAAMKEAKGE